MVAVKKTQIRQIQRFVRGNGMSEPLFQKRGERGVVIALSPGAIHTTNANGGIADTFDAKRNTLSNVDHSFFDVWTIKKRYFCVLTYHLIAPCCLPSKPRCVLKVSLRWEVGSAKELYPPCRVPFMRIQLTRVNTIETMAWY